MPLSAFVLHGARLRAGLLALLALFALSGCLEDDSIEEEGTQVDIVIPGPDDEDVEENPDLGDGTSLDGNIIIDPSSLACNIFDPDAPGAEEPERNQGVVAELFFRQPEIHPSFPSTLDYIERGTPVPNLKLFFNRLHVPTRPFDRGFVTQGGQAIQTPQGDTLYEWFALRFKGRIQLGPEDQPGPYQLAMLSDDGSILRMDRGDGEMDVLIDNDGDHPTRMACAQEALDLMEGEAVPFELDWHQGPRYHIALMMLWRPWPENPEAVNDTECGRQGNDRYFNSRNDPPTPQPAYLSLLDRGWRPLEASNYLLPKADMDTGSGSEMDPDDPENPCNAPAPLISQFGMRDLTRESVVITWHTDRPATSQIKVREAATGEDTYSEINPLYQTRHAVEMTGLKPNTLYTVTAISTAPSGLTTATNGLSFRTRR